MGYKIITAATTEPISLEEARSHLRIEPFGSPLAHPDDTMIEMLVSSAREWCEQYTGRALAGQTIEAAFDLFESDKIEMPLTPVTSVTSVKYLNTNSVETTLPTSVYALDDYSNPNNIVLKSNQSWPETDKSANNVKIRMAVGNTVSNIPLPIKSAMLLLVGSMYENRQEDIAATSKVTFNSLPLGVYNLLQPYRLELGV